MQASYIVFDQGNDMLRIAPVQAANCPSYVSIVLWGVLTWADAGVRETLCQL